jgi:hypothetical protein
MEMIAHDSECVDFYKETHSEAFKEPEEEFFISLIKEEFSPCHPRDNMKGADIL